MSVYKQVSMQAFQYASMLVGSFQNACVNQHKRQYAKCNCQYARIQLSVIHNVTVSMQIYQYTHMPACQYHTVSM